MLHLHSRSADTSGHCSKTHLYICRCSKSYSKYISSKYPFIFPPKFTLYLFKLTSRFDLVTPARLAPRPISLISLALALFHAPSTGRLSQVFFPRTELGFKTSPPPTSKVIKEKAEERERRKNLYTVFFRHFLYKLT